MYLSVIIIDEFFQSTEEMFIPKNIGKVKAGLAKLRRLNRMLAVGHRYHGYEA